MSARDLVRAEAARIRAGKDWKIWENATQDRRDAIDDAVVLLQHSIAGPWVQTGPSTEVTARWILGASPASLAPGLTRAEASAWIVQSEFAEPHAWAWSRLLVKYPDLAGANASMPGSLNMVRWVASVMRSPEQRAAFFRPRVARMGDDTEVEGRIVDRLDEINDCDVRGGPVATIDAAVDRAVRDAWSGPDELTPAQPWHETLPSGISVLRYFRDLHTEGRECRHCVAAYASSIADRSVTIVRILAPDGTRSTAAVTNGHVSQHRGPRNDPPSEACQRLLLEVVRWT